MSNIIKILLTTLIMLSVGATTLNADIEKGQMLYLKKLKKSCQIDGEEMAATYSQDEWKEFYENGNLSDELKNLCPSVPDKALKDKFLQHYFDFFFEYANDSGNSPSC